MTQSVESMVTEALTAIDLPAGAAVEPTGGATGETWKVWYAGTPYALRCVVPGPGDSARFAGQLAAMRAAGAAGLPVPEEVRHARTARVEVVLLSWLPGRTVADVLRAGLGSAYRMGELMGAAQRRCTACRRPRRWRMRSTPGRRRRSTSAVWGSPMTGRPMPCCTWTGIR